MDYLHFWGSKWHETGVKCQRCENEIFREVKITGELTTHFCCSNSACSWFHYQSHKKLLELVPMPKCSTKVDSTGEHCPEDGVYKVTEGIYFCEKCILNYKRAENKVRRYSTEAKPIYMPSFEKIKRELLPKELLELIEKPIQYQIGRKT